MTTEPETQLVSIESAPLAIRTPEQTIAFYTDVANRLFDIVEKQNLFSLIGHKKHLDAEAWETIIALDGAHTDIEWVKDIVEDGKVIGFKARALIVKNGETIASGEMSCGLDDFPCKGKSGVAQRRSGESTAQTWAVAKAARLKYAWVVTLAGYDPLPSNEARDIVHDRSEPQRGQAAKTRRPAPEPQKPQETAVRPTESPAQPRETPKGPVQQPDQLVVPDEMTGTQFVLACKSVGWSQDNIAKLLGEGLQDWMKANSVTSYRFVWDRCVIIWKKAAGESLDETAERLFGPREETKT
jgi:hypothetical protein